MRRPRRANWELVPRAVLGRLPEHKPRADRRGCRASRRLRSPPGIVMPGPRIFTFLGTGTSVGVPMIGCECAVCTSDNPRNHRYRCAVLISTGQGNILIDTPPELRLQLLRERV